MIDTILIQATAITTASAAVYTAREARSIARTVSRNEHRSKQNRRLITGSEETGRPGLQTRVRQVEQADAEGAS